MTSIFYNHEWFYRLKNSLLNKYPKSSPGLFICRYDYDVKMFAYFTNGVHFIKYIEKIPIENHNFFEVIMGNKPQKAHFDIDLKLDDNLIVKGDKLRDDLINAVIAEYHEKFNIKINISRDVLIYSSHGNNKYSCHVVIDNYCHIDNIQTKLLYKNVISRINNEHVSSIDHAVYKSVQQFRVIGSQKTGSGRIKRFHDKFVINGVEYIHNNNAPPELQLVVNFLNSLISHTKDCQVIPCYEDNSPISDSKVSTILPKDYIEAALITFANYNGMTLNQLINVYSIYNVSDNRIDLKRCQPAKCLICDRIHDHENAFLVIFGKVLHFYCRRSTKGIRIGIISSNGIDSSMIPEDNHVSIGGGLVMKVPKDKSSVGDNDIKLTNNITGDNHVSIGGGLVMRFCNNDIEKDSKSRDIVPAFIPNMNKSKLKTVLKPILDITHQNSDLEPKLKPIQMPIAIPINILNNQMKTFLKALN